VAGCCECGDEPSGSCTGLIKTEMLTEKMRMSCLHYSLVLTMKVRVIKEDQWRPCKQR
jgi:hypothetical protein